MGNEPRRPKGVSADPQSAEARLARSRAKRELFTRILLENGSVCVRLDARRHGVEVPRLFSGEVALTLDVWWKPPDAPMKLSERGVAATLHFDGETHRCLVPWSAVWGIRLPRQGALQVWEADMPIEMGGEPVPDGLVEEPVEPRPRLVLVAERTPAPEGATSEPATTPKPHLRIVK